MGSRSPVAANKPTVASSRAGDKRCPGREPVHQHTGRTVNSGRIADISCSWQRAWSTFNLHNRFRPRSCCERVPGLRAPQSPSPPASASLREYPTQLHQAYLTGQNMAIDQDIILISDSLKVRCRGVSDISASFRYVRASSWVSSRPLCIAIISHWCLENAKGLVSRIGS